jgi:hypothetical protein
MADERTENTSAATILVAVVLVLIIGLAFYFGLIRGDGGAIGGPDENTNIELNSTGDLDADADNDGSWVVPE